MAGSGERVERQGRDALVPQLGEESVAGEAEQPGAEGSAAAVGGDDGEQAEPGLLGEILGGLGLAGERQGVGEDAGLKVILFS